MKRFYTSLLAFMAIGFTAQAQIVLNQSNNVYTQNFDGIGNSANAALPNPTNVRVSADALTPRTIAPFLSATATTSFAAAANMSPSATPGAYNFGNGTSNAATDRSVGGLLGAGVNNVTIYARFNNGSNTVINSFDVSYQVRKFRNGTNPAGLRIQLFYSTDGVAWTTAGPMFTTNSLGGDPNNEGFPSTPATTLPISGQVNVITSQSNDIYFAWNISVPTGVVVTNSAALGIDAISIAADYSNILPATLKSFTARRENNGTVGLKWSAESEINMAGYEVLKSQDGQNFKPLTTVAAANRPGLQEYSYFDQMVTDADVFYRLRMVDRNGESKFSNTIALKGVRKTQVLVTPNVLDNARFNLQVNDLPKGKYQLMVYSLSGQQLTTRVIENNGGSYSDLVTLPSNTPKGYLIMRLIGRDYQYETKLLNR